MLGGEIEGEKGAVKLNELKKEHARKRVYLYKRQSIFRAFPF